MNNLLEILRGSNGGLTNRELKLMTYRNRFSDYLPWIAYDEETKVYLNSDNTIGFIWECCPLCFAGEKSVSVLEGLFRLNLPEKSIIQFILHADEYIEPFVNAYKRHKVRNDLWTHSVKESFGQFLFEGASGLDSLSGIPLRNFRLFVTLKMPLDEETERINIKDIYATTEEVLGGARLIPSHLPPEGLIDWMRRVLNDYDCQNKSYYNEGVPLGRQIILSETEIEKGLSSLKIGKKTFRCITPKSFPKEVDPLQTNQLFGGIWGMISDSDQIRTPFFYTINIIFQNMKSKLHSKCNLVLQQQAVGSFAPSLQRKKEEYLWAADELERGITFFRIIPVIWVYGNDESSVINSIVRAKRIWESQGYVMQEDRGILPILFVSALPFGLYNKGSNIDNLDRDFIAPADTITSLLPVQADYAGGGKPVLAFVGRKGQLCGLDIFDRYVNNHNVFVSAGTGSGKSFLVNYLVCNYYASDSMIRIIDIGGSYKKTAKILKGKFLDFSKDTRICLNPFSNVIEPDHDVPVIVPIVAQMVYSASTEAVPTETEMTILKNAVRWAYEEKGNEAEIDTVFEYLNSFPKYAVDFDFGCEEKKGCAEDIKAIAHTLAFNINEFTSGGVYGRYFNGRSNFNISEDEFVVLELEHLEPQKDLFKVVTLQIINAVTQDLYLSDRSRPRMIVFDEAWRFLKEGAILKAVIEEGYRRARKYGGSFSVITQSLLDLKTFGNVGDVIIANSAFKFYLESADFEKAKHEKLIDYDDFIMKILKGVKSNKPKYSEILMDTPFGIGVVRLVVDPFSYYLYTSDAREISELESLVERGMTYEDAIKEMVRKYHS